jgi:hypothetical protein
MLTRKLFKQGCEQMMESDLPGRFQQELPKEFQGSVRNMALAVNMCIQVADAERLVDQLNHEAVEENIVGQDVLLESQYCFRTRHALNLKTYAFEPSGPVSTMMDAKIEGTFLGFVQLRHSESSVLMYKLQLPYAADGRSFDVITAPVDNATITLPDAEDEDEETQEEASMYAYLDILAQLKDGEYQADLEELISLIEETEEIDAAFLSGIGDVATRMLRYPGVYDNKVMRSAICSVVALLIDLEIPYDIRGHDARYGENVTDWKVYDVNGGYMFDDMLLVNDYEINEDGFMVGSNYLQPAFKVFRSAINQTSYIPLRRLTYFADKYNDDVSCRASIDKFREQYEQASIA